MSYKLAVCPAAWRLHPLLGPGQSCSLSALPGSRGFTRRPRSPSPASLSRPPPGTSLRAASLRLQDSPQGHASLGFDRNDLNCIGSWSAWFPPLHEGPPKMRACTFDPGPGLGGVDIGHTHRPSEQDTDLVSLHRRLLSPAPVSTCHS